MHQVVQTKFQLTPVGHGDCSAGAGRRKVIQLQEILAMNVAELKACAQQLLQGALKLARTAALAGALVPLGAVDAYAGTISPSAVTPVPTAVSSINLSWKVTATVGATSFSLGTPSSATFVPTNASDPGPFGPS